MEKLGVVGISCVLIFAAPIAVCLMLVFYAALGLVVDDNILRITVLAIALCFSQKAVSGSASSWTFWISVPSLYANPCILQALPFWQGIGVSLLSSLLWLPVAILTMKED